LLQQLITAASLSGLNGSRRGGTACGFLSVKRKLCRLLFAFQQLLSMPRFPFQTRVSPTGVNTPNMFPFTSRIIVRVFAWPSHKQWKSHAPKPSLLLGSDYLDVREQRIIRTETIEKFKK
jgi:hypothetical protein